MPRPDDIPDEAAPPSAHSSSNESEDSDVFVVEKIKDFRRNKGVDEYKVRWEGYPTDEETWERRENFSSDALVAAYWQEQGKDGPPAKGVKRGKETDMPVIKKRLKQTDASATPFHGNGSKRVIRTNFSESESDSAEEVVMPAILSSSRVRPKTEAADDSEHEFGANGPPPNTDWSRHISEVVTVERTDDNTLIAYLMWKNGQKTMVPTARVAREAPLLLIKFYEKHIKFQKTDGNE